MSYGNIFILPKLNDPCSDAVVGVGEIIADRARKLNINVLTDKQSISAGTLVIAVGGDGTMLEAMRISANTGAKAFGVHMGNIGFLTDLSVREQSATAFLAAIDQLVQGQNQRTEARMVIRALMPNITSCPAIAVNEVSISQMYADAMISYRLRVVTGDYAADAGTHKANSLLVATPTGSTAYSLAAGGVLMTPEIRAFQIVPVAPTRLTARPIIASGRQKVVIEAWGDGIAVRADGQVVHRSDEQYTEDNPFVIEVDQHSSPATVVHFDGWNFFDMLQQKLGWYK